MYVCIYIYIYIYIYTLKAVLRMQQKLVRPKLTMRMGGRWTNLSRRSNTFFPKPLPVGEEARRSSLASAAPAASASPAAQPPSLLVFFKE